MDKPKARTNSARANGAHKAPPRGYGVPENACHFWGIVGVPKKCEAFFGGERSDFRGERERDFFIKKSLSQIHRIFKKNNQIKQKNVTKPVFDSSYSMKDLKRRFLV